MFLVKNSYWKLLLKTCHYKLNDRMKMHMQEKWIIQNGMTLKNERKKTPTHQLIIGNYYLIYIVRLLRQPNWNVNQAYWVFKNIPNKCDDDCFIETFTWIDDFKCFFWYAPEMWISFIRFGQKQLKNQNASYTPQDRCNRCQKWNIARVFWSRFSKHAVVGYLNIYKMSAQISSMLFE